MKDILMGVAYLIAGAILAGAGVIGYSVNDSGHNSPPFIAIVVGVLFFVLSISFFITSKNNEIK